jgi:glycosyltransferase involved in cell wall biosynthesis
VTLEAMAQNTPVLANDVSTVLADHIKDSGAGRVYSDYQTFAHALNELSGNEDLLTSMGQRGRDYVLSRYQADAVKKSLIAAIEDGN